MFSLLQIILHYEKYLVPDSSTMAAMLKREQKLRQSPSCLRAIDLPLSSRSEINRQVRLRVVREFNLPDAVADILEVSMIYFTNLNNLVCNIDYIFIFHKYCL